MVSIHLCFKLEKATCLLLQQRDKEVDRQHGVGHDLVLGHVDVADGDTETEDLLELELDGRSDFIDLSSEILRVRDRGGEFTSLGETGTEETGCQQRILELGSKLETYRGICLIKASDARKASYF